MVGEMYIAQTGYRENREDFYKKNSKRKNVNIDLTAF
jgi:hypothetical protein